MKYRQILLNLSAVIILLTLSGKYIFGAEPKVNLLNLQTKQLELQNWKIAMDVNPADSLLILPDTSWKKFSPSVQSGISEGNWLLKTELIVADSSTSSIVWGLFPIYFLSAYEIFWDGCRIAQNGKPGLNNSEEVPGAFSYYLPLDSKYLSKGKHAIVFRISNHRDYTAWKWFYGSFIIAPYEAGLKAFFKKGYLSFFMIGILLIPLFFNLFLFFSRRKKIEHLLFSFVCLLVILDYFAFQVSAIYPLKTTFLNWTIYIYGFITMMFGIVLSAFLVYMLNLQKKLILVFAAINLIMFWGFTDAFSQFVIMSYVVLISASLLTFYAVFLKREGSNIIAIGLIVSWFGHFLNYGFLSISTIMVFCSTYLIARQFARNEKNEREAQLRSSRLENELLKKNINPHFLLNTLTSIIAWFRKDPNSAIKLIEALADEFRMILQISELKLIPISQEIELCKTHLQIMSFRKGADYKFETNDIIDDELVPPMIFHTLIENGLSHGYEKKLEGTFTLTRSKSAGKTIYKLTNDGEFSSSVKTKSTGFGLKYIQSRLDESFPNRWEMSSGEIETGWENIIEIGEEK